MTNFQFSMRRKKSGNMQFKTSHIRPVNSITKGSERVLMLCLIIKAFKMKKLERNVA